MASSVLRSDISSLIFSRTKRICNRRGFSTADVFSPLTLARNPSSPIPPPPPLLPRRFHRRRRRRRRPPAPRGRPSPATQLTERTKRFRVWVTLPDDAPALEKYERASIFCCNDRGRQTFKRPGVDAFLQHLAQFYEIVVYSNQLNMILSLIGWTKTIVFVIGYQEVLLSIKTTSIIGCGL